jgi:hypothetical protein
MGVFDWNLGLGILGSTADGGVAKVWLTSLAGCCGGG